MPLNFYDNCAYFPKVSFLLLIYAFSYKLVTSSLAILEKGIEVSI